MPRSCPRSEAECVWRGSVASRDGWSPVRRSLAPLFPAAVVPCAVLTADGGESFPATQAAGRRQATDAIGLQVDEAAMWNTVFFGKPRDRTARAHCRHATPCGIPTLPASCQMMIMASPDSHLAVPAVVVTRGSRGYHLGQTILHTFRMPAHLVTKEIRLWPMVQPITQL